MSETIYAGRMPILALRGLTEGLRVMVCALCSE